MTNMEIVIPFRRRASRNWINEWMDKASTLIDSERERPTMIAVVLPKCLCRSEIDTETTERWYQKLKELTAAKKGIVTQVIRSDNLRNRHARTGSWLQLLAKMGVSLWKLKFEETDFDSFRFTVPTMVCSRMISQSIL